MTTEAKTDDLGQGNSTGIEDTDEVEKNYYIVDRNIPPR